MPGADRNTDSTAFADTDSAWWIRVDGQGHVTDAGGAVIRFLGFPDLAEFACANETGLRDFALVSDTVPAWREAWLVRACGGREAFYVQPWAGREGVFRVRRMAGEDAPLLSVDVEAMQDCWLPLFELSQSGLCIKTLDSRLVYANRALAAMLDYEPAEMTGLRCRDFVHAEDISKVEQVLGKEPWLPGEMREVALRVRTRQRTSVRTVVARYRRIKYQGQEAVVASVVDVTDLRRGESALRDYARRLQLLSRQIIHVQEHERCNLARELHDEIGQQLTMIKLSLESVQQGCEPERMLEGALESVGELTRQVRDMSLDLRPSMLDDLGLVPALRWYVGRAAQLAGMAVEFNVDEAFPRMQTDVETLFFRVAQEAITNALRHSGARQLRLAAAVCDGFVTMEVGDDGKGFDPEMARVSALSGRSAGLLGMQERAGLAGADLEIRSSPGSGTQLRIKISVDRAGVRENEAQISG